MPLGSIFLILSCLCYSFEWWMVRTLIDGGASPIEVAFYKGFFTIILIGGYYLLHGSLGSEVKKVERKSYFPLVIFGLIFLYGNSAYAEALTHTSVMNILVIMYLSIFLGIISGVVFFRERFTYALLFFAIFAFLGMTLTLYDGAYSISWGLGEWLALSIAFTLTITATIVKMTPEVSTWIRLFIAYTIGTLILFGIILAEGRLVTLFTDPLLISVGLLYSISTGLLGRGLKDLGTKTVPLSLIGIIMLLEPILQIITAGIFAKEIPSSINIIGMIIVFASIIGVSLTHNRK